MRVSEARALPLQDVTADGLLIRHPKVHKSRLLPVHETTRAALAQSRAHRRRVAGLDPPLFVTRRHGKLSRPVVTQTLHHVLPAAGIPRESGRPRPRLMALRHTFAVRALARSPERRDQSGRPTLALTPSMGHACVASPYGYLERPPPLMVAIAATCAAFVYGGTSCPQLPHISPRFSVHASPWSVGPGRIRVTALPRRFNCGSPAPVSACTERPRRSVWSLSRQHWSWTFSPISRPSVARVLGHGTPASRPSKPA
jgi:hypothetical protein